jgi:hypothetical protein
MTEQRQRMDWVYRCTHTGRKKARSEKEKRQRNRRQKVRRLKRQCHGFVSSAVEGICCRREAMKRVEVVLTVHGWESGCHGPDDRAGYSDILTCR